MIRLFIISSILSFFIMQICSCAGLSPEEKFKKSFPDRKTENITPTPIKGVYEVYTGNQLFYYAPDADLLIYGNIVNKEGASLTRESYLKKLTPKMAQIPKESALKIGKGKNIIVEFMDPDCSHCRDAYRFFSQRNDVTIYLFFFPLSQNSERKIKHILCAPDPVKMYEEVMNGKYDNNAKLNICTDKKADDILKTHKKLAGQIGIMSTPFFYFKGQVIDGFTAPMFDKLLKD